METGERSGVTACAVVFASAVKNLTIYPATHPRVRARADEFTQAFAASRQDRVELIVIGDALAIDGEAIPSNDPSLAWLASRCRLAGMRGVGLARGCTAEEVVTFATALIACRPGSGQNLCDSWRHPDAKVAPLALIVEEHHKAGGQLRPGELPPRATGTAPLSTLGKGLSDKLAEVAQRPAVRELLRTIESAGERAVGAPLQFADGEPREAVDLIGIIGELLPVDAPTSADDLAATVETILGDVRDHVAELMRDDARVRGADLLRGAIGIARGYFRRSAPTVKKTDLLPAGRPEDARITADREALLAEYRALPDLPQLRLPPASAFETQAPATGRELLGIYLHGLSQDSTEQHRRTRVELIARLVDTAEGAAAILDTYLGRKATALTMPVRLELLLALADQGLGSLLRERHYLTQELLVAGFPDSLPLAARVLSEAPDDLALMRRVLTALKPQLSSGGADAAEAAGCLRDPSLVALLTHVGGKLGTLLLGHCTANDDASHAALRAFALRLSLPPAEALALRLCDAERVPLTYVRRILRAHGLDSYDPTVRQTSASLLRDHVADGRPRLALPAMLEGITALRFVPDAETLRLLRRLARAGRFIDFTHGARAVRRCAKDTLRAIEQELRT